MNTVWVRWNSTRSCSPFRGFVSSCGRVGADMGVKQNGSVGAEATRPQRFSAMPPCLCLQSSRQSARGAQGWLALAATAAYNRSVNTATQVHRAAAQRLSLGAGYFQRSASLTCRCGATASWRGT